ncbi:MAG: nuclear transport factor 2 family protein [Candidatus Bathyarchaeota archaeon]|nr:nuclear transport factor 2 family protein [Candidatus Bathyarchaeota archaeon]
MKADPKTQAEVTLAFKGMFDAYKKQDLKTLLTFWAPDPDIFILGSGADEKGTGLADLKKSLKRDWAQGTVESIGIKNFAVSAAGFVAWLCADISFHGKAAEGGVIDFAGRLTGVMENRNGKWLWMQMHLSLPSSLQAEGQSWPTPR